MVACLDGEGDIEVLAELERGDQVVPMARALAPHVAILGTNLTGKDGFTVAAELHAAVPECQALIISSERSPCVVRRAAEAHAAGVVVCDAATESLTEAVRRVAKGTKVVDPELAFAALNMADNPLTPREIDALRYAAQGATSAEIATQLCLSVGTVRNYVSRAIAKTGGRNRVDAIRIAELSGWL
jgi:two-component system, NarL family, response regulator DesR